MTIGDWRRLAAPRMAALYEAEARWWQTHLGWDLTRALQDLESARLDGRLPGLTVLDGYGDPIGWTYFSGSGEVVQVGAIVAGTRAGSVSPREHRRRRRGRRGRDDRARARAARCAGSRRGVLGARVRVRDVSLSGSAHAAGHCRATRDSPVRRGRCHGVTGSARARVRWIDRASAVRTWRHQGRMGRLRRSVADDARVRPVHAARQRGLRGRRRRRHAGGINITGAAIVTAISDTHAHLAQVAVDPGARSQGIGKALIDGASASARACGFSRLTLFVAGGNRRARALYDRLGFRVTTSFTAAVRVQPRLSTSVAPSAGGARTLR